MDYSSAGLRVRSFPTAYGSVLGAVRIEEWELLTGKLKLKADGSECASAQVLGPIVILGENSRVSCFVETAAPARVSLDINGACVMAEWNRERFWRLSEMSPWTRRHWGARKRRTMLSNGSQLRISFHCRQPTVLSPVREAQGDTAYKREDKARQGATTCQLSVERGLAPDQPKEFKQDARHRLKQEKQELSETTTDSRTVFEEQKRRTSKQELGRGNLEAGRMLLSRSGVLSYSGSRVRGRTVEEVSDRMAGSLSSSKPLDQVLPRQFLHQVQDMPNPVLSGSLGAPETHPNIGLPASPQNGSMRLAAAASRFLHHHKSADITSETSQEDPRSHKVKP
ncbi:hypothetical protein B0H17DRAFT_1135454 [Mycena rosella]|uniref:Uncharacterized protein n=1 Tax=Mycena rosella TaxID=1033263 RepID=A0AAD7DG25_MYCRO|nr:hypothetical protein B0H17DRAFT_1135454 [Mycena rosella]